MTGLLAIGLPQTPSLARPLRIAVPNWKGTADARATGSAVADAGNRRHLINETIVAAYLASGFKIRVMNLYRHAAALAIGGSKIAITSHSRDARASSRPPFSIGSVDVQLRKSDAWRTVSARLAFEGLDR